ncbi:transcriptional repressor NrdR [Candidatus Saccharibacteria bacterium]|nr:transcriptional repressor NrdR [Candidatus Saccharibacteria bacterium]
MRCPNCGSSDSKVLESREHDPSGIRRRRECNKCGRRFTTYERIETPHLMIIKKNGDRESYDRDKLAKGLYKACEKRPIPVEKIEAIISRIEQALYGKGERELKSTVIGGLVMKELLVTDEVAYVRFASVYRSFTGIASFERELNQLKKRKPGDTKK